VILSQTPFAERPQSTFGVINPGYLHIEMHANQSVA
jgi:hypothetical protein